MRRREFLILLGGAASSPLAARAEQKGGMAVIGYLGVLTEAGERQAGAVDSLRAGLRDLGYVEGENLSIEARYADGQADRLPALAAELIGLNVSLIVAGGPGVYTASRVTKTVPIVMGVAGDVVAMGLAASLSHPGGNVTGMAFFVPELMAKRLQLLKDVAGALTSVGVLLLSNSPSTRSVLEAMSDAAAKEKVELTPIEVAAAADFERGFSAIPGGAIGGFVCTDQPQFLANAALIADVARSHNLPSIGSPAYASAGGLMGYGVNFGDMFRRSATFVDKILRGARPDELPIEQASKFTTIINLKTAKALAIEIPPTLLAAADEVIE
jgi:putative ABC transport system substrate-binding protein